MGSTISESSSKTKSLDEVDIQNLLTLVGGMEKQGATVGAEISDSDEDLGTDDSGSDWSDDTHHIITATISNLKHDDFKGGMDKVSTKILNIAAVFAGGTKRVRNAADAGSSAETKGRLAIDKFITQMRKVGVKKIMEKNSRFRKAVRKVNMTNKLHKWQERIAHANVEVLTYPEIPTGSEICYPKNSLSRAVSSVSVSQSGGRWEL